MAFDQTASDLALKELCRQVLADPDFVGGAWESAALVIQVQPRKRMFGYVYWPDGSWVAAIPALRRTIEKTQELAAAMQVEGKPGWKTCLLQFIRSNSRIKADFEYDDAARWDVTPGNLQRRVEELRPR
jgi:hypothetical protein